jgi:hypothetical protein
MKINIETLMARANENYRDMIDDDFAAIKSRQVKALAQAVAEVLEIIQDETWQRFQESEQSNAHF